MGRPVQTRGLSGDVYDEGDGPRGGGVDESVGDRGVGQEGTDLT